MVTEGSGRTDPLPGELVIAPDGAEERKLVREAFVAVIPGRPEHTCSNEDRAEGWICDGNKGVQWNAGTQIVAARGIETQFGVNLEGILYGRRRPIASLLKRERENPRVFEAIDEIDRIFSIIQGALDRLDVANTPAHEYSCSHGGQERKVA